MTTTEGWACKELSKVHFQSHITREEIIENENLNEVKHLCMLQNRRMISFHVQQNPFIEEYFGSLKNLRAGADEVLYSYLQCPRSRVCFVGVYLFHFANIHF